MNKKAKLWANLVKNYRCEKTDVPEEYLTEVESLLGEDSLKPEESED